MKMVKRSKESAEERTHRTKNGGRKNRKIILNNAEKKLRYHKEEGTVTIEVLSSRNRRKVRVGQDIR
jgi:hypothetical protein